MKFERVHDVKWRSEVQVQTVTDDDPDANFTARALIQLVQYDNWLRPVFAVIWEVDHFSRGEYLGQTYKHLGDFDSFFEAVNRADYVYMRRFQTKQYLDLVLHEKTREAYAA